MSLIKEVTAEVVDDKKLTIVDRHKGMLLNIVLIGCIMWLVIYILADKDKQIEREKNNSLMLKEILEVSVQVDQKTNKMNELRDQIKEQLNPTKPTK